MIIIFLSCFLSWFLHTLAVISSASIVIPHLCSHILLSTLTPFQENSRQVPTTEGSAFASRQSALFVEASAKTAIGVRDVFEELVGRILETPELWAPVQQDTNGGLVKRGGEDGMPGTIDLGRNATPDDGGCSC
jgi:hypothetical protein